LKIIVINTVDDSATELSGLGVVSDHGLFS
jgi:hypothetical protein